MAGSGFVHGAGYAFAALRLVRKDTVIRRRCLSIGLLYLLMWLLAIAAAVTFGGDLIARILGAPGEAWWAEALWWLGRVVLWIGWLLAVVLAMAALASPLLSPWLTGLAGLVTSRVTGQAGPHESVARVLVESLRDAGRAAVLAVVELSGAAAWSFGGWLLGMAVPPVGAVIGVGLGGAWSATFKALTAMSFGLDNRHVRLLDQFALVRGRLTTMLGLGLPVQLLMWLPLTLPIAVVAGELAVIELVDAGAVPALPDRRDPAR